MKIGIFGGSFSPVTLSHIQIARKSIEELNLDKLFLVPSFINPNKKHKKEVENHHRINMLNLVKEKKMEILDYEIKNKQVSYTYKTIEYLKLKFPNDELFLILGSDNVKKINTWEKIDYISKNINIHYFKRGNDFKSHINVKKFNCKLIDSNIENFSSTKFLEGDFLCVDERVRKYIFENFLYFEEILERTLTQKRFIHSLNAAKFALEIVSNINTEIDKKRAWQAAFLHDIAKEIDEIKARKILKKYNYNHEIEYYKLHQELGYVILKEIFLCEDDKFMNSIRVHTSLSLELSTLDKIVFLADKLCVGRKWEGIQEIRNIIKEDFGRALSLVVKKTWDLNLEKQKEITKEQKEIYEKWIK